MRTAWYVSEYTDETMPCEANLQAWAKWLSEPAPDFHRPEPAKDGDTFQVTAMDFEYHKARRIDGKWHLPPEVTDDADFIAVAVGDGEGWFAEHIACDRANLIDILIDLDDDDEEWIAVGTDHPTRYVGTFRSAGPSLDVEPVGVMS